ESGVGPEPMVFVQTYHTALALARHGHGVAVVDSCTALSAPEEMDVVPLRPSIRVPLYAARPASMPASVAARAFTRAVQQALRDLLDGGDATPSTRSSASPRKRR